MMKNDVNRINVEVLPHSNEISERIQKLGYINLENFVIDRLNSVINILTTMDVVNDGEYSYKNTLVDVLNEKIADIFNVFYHDEDEEF